jgi:hypothetical protein
MSPAKIEFSNSGVSEGGVMGEQTARQRIEDYARKGGHGQFEIAGASEALRIVKERLEGQKDRAGLLAKQVVIGAIAEVDTLLAEIEDGR